MTAVRKKTNALTSLPLGWVPMHASALLGACIASSASDGVNMLSRNMPDIAYTAANFAQWDGWTKVYAITAVILAALLSVYHAVKKKPLFILRELILIIAAYFLGLGLAMLWSYFESSAHILVAVPEIIMMIARWTWLPHTIGAPMLLYRRRRTEKKRDDMGHDSIL